MDMLNTFVRPEPNPGLIKFLNPVNRYLCLQGLPFLRDIPLLKHIIGFRGICQIRYIEYSENEFEQLKTICGEGKATFFVPNHPEFFTDWMLDKFICSKVSPLVANWATNQIVNGLGKLMQRFWLANNLIAQIPGNSKPSRDYSIEWAMQGNGVLLHPEGSVGWHSNHIAALYPGAFSMANETLKRAEQSDQNALEVYVAPLIWKLVFIEDVSHRLLNECRYIEKSLDIADINHHATPADRVYHIFNILLQRDEKKWSRSGKLDQDYRQRQQSLLDQLKQQLSSLTAYVDDGSNQTDELKTRALLSAAKRFLREADTIEKADIQPINDLINTISRHQALADYAFQSATITQEEIADHIKRIRRDYCKGKLRDTLNAFVPQAAGLRRAHIRIAEPFAVHENPQQDGTEQLRQRLQQTLDELNEDLDRKGKLIKTKNPFFSGADQ